MPSFVALAVGSFFALSAADVVLELPRSSVTFDSMEADFGPSLTSDGYTGKLVLARPSIYGCNPLDPVSFNSTAAVALIQRGPSSNPCDYALKVKNAEAAGYGAVIVYDNFDEDLITMEAPENDVGIPSVFVTLSTGEALTTYESQAIVRLLPNDPPTWPSFLMTFVVISATTCVVMSVFVLYRRRSRYFTAVTRTTTATRDQINSLQSHKYDARAAHASASAAQASADEAKHTDQADGDSVSTSSGVTSCCICLEEFEQDDMLLTLPCGHSYHRSCIEPWLTRRQRTCPLCKRDPFPAEDTPLLSQA
eukprot:TRINITY_DN9901_c1_g2_i5.p1 TRINITY_DN9901_c1_g2~~TRINITY_DN9901_c1_g2_i5.p1  ORF type:complete len:308 (+),score=46.74 TRINITY_DN9901_c1_g2_i5:48-971(+)